MFSPRDRESFLPIPKWPAGLVQTIQENHPADYAEYELMKRSLNLSHEQGSQPVTKYRTTENKLKINKVKRDSFEIIFIPL